MTAIKIGYARCSTDRQDLTAQRAALAELGVTEDRIYTDHGLTGTNRDRPGLAQALAAVLVERGAAIVSGGTDSHLMLVDLRPKGVTGKATEAALEHALMTCNKNGVPFDTAPFTITSGVRLGTPAGTKPPVSMIAPSARVMREGRRQQPPRPGGGGGVAPFVAAMRTFLGDPNALTGNFAYGNRSVGNLARPYFPDGEAGRPPGPLSRDIAGWSPFSTGLQSALIVGNLAQHLAFVTGQSAQDTPRNCTGLPGVAGGNSRLANGIQIFPGSVPVYRGNVLVGGIGVSGDGIDQDDMISFLGLHNGANRAGGGLGNAPAAIRADRIVVAVGNRQVRLRYVNCPFAPFLDTAAQNVCEGL